MDVILQAIRLLCQILLLAIFVRIIISWLAPMISNTFTDILFRLTEPILAPIRNLLPRMGMFDFSPLVALLVLQIIIYVTYWLG